MENNETFDLNVLGKLTSYQHSFVKEFLRPELPRFSVLISPVGAGKTTTGVAVTSSLIERADAKRILILAPTLLLVDQWRYLLKHSEALGQVDVVVVKRSVFRELQTRVPVNQDPWTESIFLMSLNTVKHRDVTSSLKMTTWDLVIVDEAHHLTGMRRQFLKELVEGGGIRRLLLMTATLPEDKFSWLASDLVITDWKYEWEKLYGQLVAARMISWELIRYTRTPEEIAFLNALKKYVNEKLSYRLDEESFHLLLQMASSSIFSVEQTLLRMRGEMETDPYSYLHTQYVGVETHFSSVLVDEELQNESFAKDTSITVPESKTDIDELLSLLDSIASDTKLAALQNHVGRFMESIENVSICVFSSFRTSAEYIHTALVESGKPSNILTASLSDREKEKAIQRFTTDGGILVATTAALKGFELEFVDAVIAYEVPADKRVFYVWLSRIDRLSRRKPCTLCAIYDESNTLPLEKELIESYGWRISSGSQS